MADIQWFPGHMTKAMRLTEANIKLVDTVIYVLDARAPYSCLNPKFFEVSGAKPVVYVLNKIDLADKAATEKWVRRLTSANSTAVTASATSGFGIKGIVAAVKRMSANKSDRWAGKGLKYTPKVMVAGIPNTGKSTVINALCGSGKAAAANRPGVTRGKQWVKTGGVMDLLDTPGIMPPKFEDQTVARHLAYLGSIRDEILDTEELAVNLVGELSERFSGALEARYNITIAPTAAETLKQIAVKRGMMLKGGEADMARACITVIDDFRKARLGYITLETPEEYEIGQ